MDRQSSDRPVGHNQAVPPPTSSHFSPLPLPSAQPALHVPVSDLFHTNRDHFLTGNERRPSLGLTPWPTPVQGTSSQLHHRHYQQQLQHQPHQHPPSHNQSGASTPSNAAAMASPYDPARRRSLGAAASPPQYVAGPLEPPPPPLPAFPTRNMPPPSPPQNAPSSHHLGSAPRGPPTTSPFPGVRDLTSHRSGMSISAILDGNDERRPTESPRSAAAAPPSTPKSMQPPSPARARSSSMRESGDRNLARIPSPPRMGIFGEPGRTPSEPRRDGIFGSPQFRRDPAHGFRAYPGPSQEHAYHTAGNGAPMRPNSQPTESAGVRGVEEMSRREASHDARSVSFRPFGEPTATQRSEIISRADRLPFQNGLGLHPQERPPYGSPQTEQDNRAPAPAQFPRGPNFGPPGRDEPLSSFRPAFPPTSHPPTEPARESIENRAQDMRRQLSQPSPSSNGMGVQERGRNGYPIPPEIPQRADMPHRDLSIKDSETSVHRAVLNLGPELSRRGRNSPLPQAVQGAQPRHIGPGGDNPGIKMEFGRMFSGLGSGVGSTPHPHHHAVNGTSTPSRMSPARHLDNGDLVRTAVAELDNKKASLKAGSGMGKRTSRRARDKDERLDREGNQTPDLEHSNKRTKITHPPHHHHHVHPHHHHHHHHHELQENGSTAHNMIRFPSNPLSQAGHTANPTHHHHHHHAHPAHHHHPARAVPPPRKPSMTVVSKKVLDEVAAKPRKHLGSQLYATEVSMPPPADVPMESRPKFSSKMKPIPVFEGQENCTFMIRVPRYFLTPSNSGSGEHESLEEICRRRQLWGTDVYTDDTDVVAAAVHSGWLQGDFGPYNDDISGIDDNLSGKDGSEQTCCTLDVRPQKPVKVPQGHDAHITVLILPALESYASTNQHHIWSRGWNQPHDGMSFMIHKIEFVHEGKSSRYAERGAAARKGRIAAEEAARREAAAGLLSLMSANSNGNSTVSVGA